MTHPENTCPQCGSSNIWFVEGFGFYACGDCEHNWAYDCDDPDYEEPKPIVVETTEIILLNEQGEVVSKESFDKLR